MFEKDRFFELIRKTPKAEIHLHFEDFIFEGSEKITNLPEMLDAYRSAQFSRKTVEDFDATFRRLARYMTKNGVIYAEVFFSPRPYLRSGWKYQDMIKYFEKQIRLIRMNDGLTIKLLIDPSRTYGVESAESILDLVIKYKSDAVIGIGLGGNEVLGPAKNFANLFARARAAGLHTVAHAGESVGCHSIVDSIELLKVERIGHGVSAVESEEVIAMLADTRIPLEIQLTSNIVTGHYIKNIEEHPVKMLMQNGVFITLNTDDPNIFNTSLLNEYWLLYSKLGFNLNEIYRIIINGFRAAFLTETKKREYIKSVNHAWGKFRISDSRQRQSWINACKSLFERIEY